MVTRLSIHALAQGQGQGKGYQKKEQGPGKQAHKDHGNKGQSQDQPRERGRDKEKTVAPDDNMQAGKGDEKRNLKAVERNYRGKDDVRKVIGRDDRVFVWNRENFKNRNSIRNEGKVTVCHKLGRNEEPPVTLSISRNALQAHLDHGDAQGSCPEYRGDRSVSDVFIRRRNDYYNTIFGAREQVVYSQSILDYALERLTGARAQLVTLQTINAPANEIERKQAVVLELEENVSLLEAALAAAAGLLAAKLVD